ncbi:Kinesin-like protein kif3a [Geranomyces variabilis]|nr:Kinesin-like protein kif3a [Geranomyces variabilis]
MAKAKASQQQMDAQQAAASMTALAAPTPQRVLVAVRVRPPTVERKSPQKYAANLGYDPTANCITYNPSTVTIQWPASTPTSPSRGNTPAPGGGPKTEPKKFNFDSVLGYEEGQAALYGKIVDPLIRKCLEGYNGCVFCYGQTASGKTYTMEGPSRGPGFEPSSDPKSPDTGIILRVASQIVTHISDAAKTNPELEYFVKASYLEIYQEQLTDLLVEREEQSELKIRQDPNSTNGRDLYISGITEKSVNTLQDYTRLMHTGSRHRTVGETNMNEVSSRSHAVLTITIEERRKPEAGMSTEEAEMLAKHGKKRSKIHLIDLAGSERANATGATGDRLKEGSAINQSLSCLGNVINALTTSTKHVPYRDSKLTYLLSDSLGGNSLTLMITCVTPTIVNFDESLSTLRFAERVKKVRNVAKVNVDATMMRIMTLEAELRELRAALARCTCGANASYRTGGGGTSTSIGTGSDSHGHDAWTMAHTHGVNAQTATDKRIPWWKKLCCCCFPTTSGATAPAKKTAKVGPAPVPERSAPMTPADGDQETVLKSVKGKLTFS